MLLPLSYAIVLVIYSIAIITLSIFWKRIPIYKLSKNKKESIIEISVIIALRNEENNLSHLVNSLVSQSGNSYIMEVILVDDHSTDNTPTLLLDYSQKYTQIQVIQLEDSFSGKKAALKAGALKAKGELLCFTDADCFAGNQWLESYASFYIKNNKPDMIIGLVDMISDSFLSDLFRVEFLSMILAGAGTYSLGHPTLCNGANLAVKASTYKNYFPESRAVSGDDVFLLHQIKRSSGTIKLLKSKENLIYTKGVDSLKNFIIQRRRWASKSVFYKDKATILMAFAVFIANLSLLCGVFVSITNNCNYLFLVFAYTLKITSDYYLFFKGKILFQIKGLLGKVFLIELFYPFYIVYTALTSIKKPFEWKGRKQII